jgi:hypothetical protein
MFITLPFICELIKIDGECIAHFVSDIIAFFVITIVRVPAYFSHPFSLSCEESKTDKELRAITTLFAFYYPAASWDNFVDIH